MKQHLLRRVALSIVFAAFLMVAGGKPVAAAQGTKPPDKAKIEAARAFFKGKSISFVVPYGPGGGYDATARLMQRFMGKHLPGSMVLVKNVPGAGSMVATNQLYVGKPNGLTIAILSGVGMAANQIAGSPVSKYDVTKFTYLGRIKVEKRVLVAGMKSKVKDLESLMKSTVPVKLALGGPGSGAYAVSQLIVTALGFPSEEILGYEGSASIIMSLIREETDIHITTEDTAMPFLNRKELRAIFQVAPKNIEGLEKIPNLLTKDVDKLKLSEAQLKRIRLASDLMALGYIFVAPPQLPPERAWVLEETVQKTIRDPEFVALAKKSGVAPNIDPLTGKELIETMHRLINVAPDVKALMHQLMKEK